jgi:hypothetical protein
MLQKGPLHSSAAAAIEWLQGVLQQSLRGELMLADSLAYERHKVQPAEAASAVAVAADDPRL